MKRLVIIFAMLVSISGSAMAGGMMFGFKGGIMLANASGDISENAIKTGYGSGIFTSHALTELFSLQPEVLFVMKGTRHEEESDRKFKLNYIEIPLLAKVSLSTEGDFSPVIFAGPAIGILMTAKDTNGDVEVDVKENFKSTDFSLVAGAGFDYMIGRECLIFDVRYTVGLVNVVESDEDGDDFDWKNTDFMFMAGYGFAF